jgi:hypothetical protein
METESTNVNPAGGDAGGSSDGQADADVRSRIDAIVATEGFLDGTLKRRNISEYNRLLDERRQLYERLYPAAPQAAQDAPQSTNAPDSSETSAGQQRLISEAQEVMDRLVSAGFQRDDIPSGIQPYQVEDLKAQAAIASGDYAAAGDILSGGVLELTNAGAIPNGHELAGELRRFFGSDSFDPELKGGICDVVLHHVHKLRRQHHETLHPSIKATTPAARIKQIMAALTPELKRSNPSAYTRLLEEKHKLYQQKG